MLRPAREVVRETNSSEFKNLAVFKDEDDVRTLFKDKPEQRDSILANAPTIECPTRGVKLYGIPDYTASLPKIEHISSQT